MAIVSVSRTSITDEGRSRSLIAVSPAEVIGGMVLITPTSIVSTGTGNSSSIGANGSVEFSSCATLSLNGVFSATYDNYMVAIRFDPSADVDIQMRLRASGTDNSTASSYVTQYIYATSTSVTSYRSSAGTIAAFLWGRNVQRNGATANFYGPYLAQPTAFRTVSVDDVSSASLIDVAGTHNQSTAYDGFTLTVNGGTFDGLVSVYGLVGA
jgi:hypothetical protein